MPKPKPVPHKCETTKLIENEFELKAYRCVLDLNHDGQHKTYYRYFRKVGGRMIGWSEGDKSKLVFEKDELVELATK